ncbi:MAG: hypothetical protein PHO32_09085 [Candidatus Cloacimonetes bacterium]|nr:hypothetical protein [Candidatus Cloacimonadota bacterium]
MAKLLNLYLHYKGIDLDNVRFGRDFTKKWTIGSSKYQFWQILDNKFPEKHLLVTGKGDKFVMQLPPGAQVSCKKDGNQVDSSFLTKNSLLSGGELLLQPDMAGMITLSPEWAISYDFKEPRVVHLTPEEQQIAVQYARYAEPDVTERFNRNLIWLFVFLTIVFAILFDLFFKQTTTFDSTMEQKLLTLQKAELVKLDQLEKEGSSFEVQGDAEEAAAPEAAATTATTAGTGTGNAQSAGAIFGGLGNFDPNATSAAPAIRAVTVAEGFTSSRAGRGGGSGAGTGGGGPGAGGGYSSSFDASAAGGFSSDMGSVATSAPRVGGSSIRPNAGNIVKVAGDQSKLAPSGVVFGQTAAASKIASSFRSKNIQQVKEGSLDALPAETKTASENIGNTIQSRRGQIYNLYAKWNAITPFSGSISTRLLIGSNGRVQAAMVTPNGQMPEGFLQEVKALCESWTFNVNVEFDYVFTTRVRKG